MKTFRKSLFAIVLAMLLVCSLALFGCSDDTNTPEDLKALAAPTGLAYANGAVTWQAVTGATAGYTVVITQGTEEKINKTVTEATVDVSELAAGNYKASVKANAVADKNKESAAATLDFTVESGEPAELEALATPTGLAYAEGAVTWQAVTGATAGYTVVITQGTEEKINKTVTEATVDVSELAAGNYKASVKANAVADKNKESAAATLDFTVESAELEALATPTGLAYANGAVTWQAVTGATAGYTVVITQGTEEKINKTVTEATVDVSELAAGNYKASVKANAVADKNEESAAATLDFTVEAAETVLETPSDIAYNATADTLSWTAVTGADFYEVEVKKGETVVYTNDELVENTVDATAWPSGEFSVSVKACSLEDNVKDSEAGTATINIDSLGELKAPENVKVQGGALVWDENNARGYTVVIKAKTGTDTVGDVVEATPVWGENSLNVAAMGLANGGYVASIKATSNRHSADESAAVEKDFSIEVVEKFLPDAIASFDGNMPRGEHGAVEKVTVGGVDYARVTPTADGWGRVCSPNVTVDWDSKPVVYLEMGNVTGGYHMELYYNGNKVNCLRDTQNTESTVVDLIAQVVKEGADAADYEGIRTVALRLGVDHSTDKFTNDAIADYKSVTVLYVTDYKTGLTEETKLTTPEGMMVDAFGVMEFNGVQYAKRYEITVTDTVKDEQVGEKLVLTAPSIDLKQFATGEYELSIVARNPVDANALDSDAAIFAFKVEELVSFTAEEITTAADGKFTSTGNGVTARYDSESGLAVVNEPVTTPADPEAGTEAKTEIKGWGAIGMKDGVNVNFTRNPIILVDVERLEGGKAYYAKASWDGQGSFNTNNDTPANITSSTVLAIRGGWNSDNNQLGVGEKGGFKFEFGVTGSGTTAYLNGIKIVQIYATGALPRPETPVQLSRPSGITIQDRTLVKANAVAGNAEYTPSYKITVTEKGTENVVTELTKQELPQILLSRLTLESGKTYTVSIVAEGDTYEDDTKPFFANSEAATMDIKYTHYLTIDDFSDYVTTGDGAMWKHVGGGNTIQAENDGNALKISTTNDWGMIQLPIFTGELAGKDDISEVTALEFHFGEVTGPTAFTSRYFSYTTVENEDGTTTENLVWADGRGDTSIKTGDILVETNFHARATFVTFDGENGFLVGIGFGGGTTERSYQIVKIVIAAYEEVKA